MNSLDKQFELLKAARAAVQALEPVMSDLNGEQSAEWHPATLSYRSLKEAIARYDGLN